jgi:conserved oligomeric Golgi complex subunit 7
MTDVLDNDNFDYKSIADLLENTPDVETWLNSILDDSAIIDHPLDSDSRSLANLNALDRRVSNVLSSLEVASEDASAQLERIIDDISRGAPRLAYDLHFMKEGALSLQNSLHKLQQSSAFTDSPETKAALERLHYLDSVKRHMEAARDVLKEAESWSTLESDILSLLSEQNYEKAAETLSEAAKSMVVFQNTPEFEVRRSLMVSLQNQLEASLSSALVAAINSQNVAVCRSYFSIFSNIQRGSEFRNYYYGSRRTSLLAAWQKTRLRDLDAVTDSAPDLSLQPFVVFLPTFYASFLFLLEAERLSIPSIFPDPQATLSALISSVLSSLQPTLSQRISSLVNHYGPSTLTEIIAAYTASVDFALATENVVEKIGYSMSSLLHQTSDESDGSQHARRRSRLSISRRIGSRASISIGAPGGVKPALSLYESEWQQELFEPFLDYQVDYGSLEQKFLSDRLNRIVSNEPTATGKSRDTARWLKERSVDVFSLADQSLARCMSFTHGYGVVSLIQALDNTFKSVIGSSTDDIPSSSNGSTALEQVSTLGGEDLSDMDYTAQDWSRIQLYLHLLDAARGFHDRLLMFENKLRSNLIQAADTLRAVQNDIQTGGRSMSGIARGAFQLLSQSTLNSAELQELLSGIETDPRSPLLSASSAPRPPLQSPKPPLMTGSHAAISNFARTCQLSLQRTILSPLHKHLASYPGLAIWSSQGDPTSRVPGARGAVNEVYVPVFSISPSDTVQRVAEGLLNLPRLFEVYADDDALSFSIETLPYVDKDLLKSVSEHGHNLEPAPTSPMVQATLRRSPSISFRASAQLTALNTSPALALTPEVVSAAWLSSLALSLLSSLTSSVLPSIKTLTTAGAAQLSSDLAYLSNVVQVLNVHSAELEKWKELSEMSDEEGRRQTKERDERDDQVSILVASIRGWG